MTSSAEPATAARAADARRARPISMRWWDVGAAVTLVVSLALVAVSDLARPWAPATVVVLAVVWVALVRPVVRLDEDRLTPRGVLAATALAASVALGVAASPELAVQQALAMPLLWTLVPGPRRATLATVVLALLVAAGFTVSLGWDRGGLVTLVTSQGLTIVFSVALGLWITSIARVGAERGALLDELRAAQEQLAARSRDDGTVAERARLAREIHDTLAQSLTGLVLLTQQARASLRADDRAAVAERLDVVEESARHALGEARALVAATAPAGVDGTDLAGALRRVADRVVREAGVAVRVELDDVGPLPREHEVVLVRAAQEALANVRRHARSATARLALSRDGDDVLLTVADDGLGFDPAAPRTGFGLDGLGDRLRLAGGSLAVSSSAAGTVLVARLPAAVEPARGSGAGA